MRKCDKCELLDRVLDVITQMDVRWNRSCVVMCLSGCDSIMGRVPLLASQNFGIGHREQREGEKSFPTEVCSHFVIEPALLFVYLWNFPNVLYSVYLGAYVCVKEDTTAGHAWDTSACFARQQARSPQQCSFCVLSDTRGLFPPICSAWCLHSPVTIGGSWLREWEKL